MPSLASSVASELCGSELNCSSECSIFAANRILAKDLSSLQNNPTKFGSFWSEIRNEIWSISNEIQAKANPQITWGRTLGNALRGTSIFRHQEVWDWSGPATFTSVWQCRSIHRAP